MGKRNTKQIILAEALNLFAIYGYQSVSVAQIADAVGIKVPSLYKHYKSKQEIFDMLLQDILVRMSEARNRLAVPIDEKMTDIYDKIDLDSLSQMFYSMLSFYLEDGMVSKYRRFLSIERYSNPEAERLYQKMFIDNVLELETALFRELISRGHFIDTDPDIMALHFYSPIFLLINKYDNSTYDPENLKCLTHQLVYSFSEIYVKKELSKDE